MRKLVMGLILITLLPLTGCSDTPSLQGNDLYIDHQESQQSVHTEIMLQSVDEYESKTNRETLEAEVVALINETRAQYSAGQVEYSPILTEAARIRAQELTLELSHTRPSGEGFQTALDEQKIIYRLAGENIAAGQNTAEEVVSAWMNSETHKASILYGRFDTIGVGLIENADGRHYWALLFVEMLSRPQ